MSRIIAGTYVELLLQIGDHSPKTVALFLPFHSFRSGHDMHDMTQVNTERTHGIKKGPRTYSKVSTNSATWSFLRINCFSKDLLSILACANNITVSAGVYTTQSISEHYSLVEALTQKYLAV